MTEEDTEPINRRLTDDERNLMMKLAIGSISKQTGLAPETVAIALDSLIDEGAIHLEGDQYEARVIAASICIVRAARDWLAFTAAFRADETIEQILQDGHPTKRGDAR